MRTRTGSYRYYTSPDYGEAFQRTTMMTKFINIALASALSLALFAGTVVTPASAHPDRMPADQKTYAMTVGTLIKVCQLDYQKRGALANLMEKFPVYDDRRIMLAVCVAYEQGREDAIKELS